MPDTQLRDHILDLLDQTDSNDRLITPATVDSYLQRSRILSNRELKRITDPIGDTDTVTYDEDNHLVTILMDDLFLGDSSLQRKTYIFEPVQYFHPTGFSVLVSGTAADEADYTFDALSMQVTFDTAHSSDVQVKLKGHLVDITSAVRLSVTYLRHKLAATPDIFGSNHKEWEVRLSQLEAEYMSAESVKERLW